VSLASRSKYARVAVNGTVVGASAPRGQVHPPPSSTFRDLLVHERERGTPIEARANVATRNGCPPGGARRQVEDRRARDPASRAR
jgi:hypothetical protein